MDPNDAPAVNKAIKAVVEMEGKILQREIGAYLLTMKGRSDPQKYAWINRLLIRR